MPAARRPQAKAKKHPAYWKVKAAHLEYEKAALEWAETTRAAKAAAIEAKHALRQALTDAGLDPDATYEMHQDTETIVLKTT